MRIPKFSNLYGRIFAIFWLTMLMVLVAVLILQDIDPRQTQPVPRVSMEKLLHIADSFEKKYSKYANIDTLLEQLNTEKKNRENSNKITFFLSDKSGSILGNNSGMQRRTIQNFVTSIETQDTPKQKLYGRFLISGPIPVVLANQELYLYIGKKWEQNNPILLRLFERPVHLLLAVMFVSTPFLLWLAYALSLPARRLESAAKRVANGEFEVDPSLEKGSSEFQQAGAAFNQMVLAINQMLSGHQRLLSDISHELRSPLTRLRMANALATRKLGSSDELKRIDTEAERLEKMIGELLELSRMQVNSHQVREKQTAYDLWDELIKDAQFEAEQVSKKLAYSSIPNCMLVGNPSLLMSAVENIIRNAIHYSQDRINISFSVADNRLSIKVEDNGEGVPESELNDIFRPFYRVSTARDRHSGGTGLGLAITESAVRQHNGSIEAKRSELGGLAVTITLPVN